MTTRIKVKKSEVKDIIKATFPQYRGRTIHIEFTPTVRFHDTNWGGGSKSTYAAIASDGRTARLNVPAPWINTVEGQSVDIPMDVLIVRHSIFCGKDCGITIYANPAHAPKWIPPVAYVAD